MFRFRLQQVLDLREQREREVASQLAEALGAERRAQSHLDTLRATRDASGPTTGTTRSVGELAHLAFVLEQLDGHIESARHAVEQAGRTVADTKDAFTTALQDRRVLDRLRERHEETYRTATEQQDRRTMDDIALVRFTQGETE